MENSIVNGEKIGDDAIISYTCYLISHINVMKNEDEELFKKINIFENFCFNNGLWGPYSMVSQTFNQRAKKIGRTDLIKPIPIDFEYDDETYNNNIISQNIICRFKGMANKSVLNVAYHADQHHTFISLLKKYGELASSGTSNDVETANWKLSLTKDHNTIPFYQNFLKKYFSDMGEKNNTDDFYKNFAEKSLSLVTEIFDQHYSNKESEQKTNLDFDYIDTYFLEMQFNDDLINHWREILESGEKSIDLFYKEITNASEKKKLPSEVDPLTAKYIINTKSSCDFIDKIDPKGKRNFKRRLGVLCGIFYSAYNASAKGDDNSKNILKFAYVALADLIKKGPNPLHDDAKMMNASDEKKCDLMKSDEHFGKKPKIQKGIYNDGKKSVTLGIIQIEKVDECLEKPSTKSTVSFSGKISSKPNPRSEEACENDCEGLCSSSGIVLDNKITRFVVDNCISTSKPSPDFSKFSLLSSPGKTQGKTQ